MNRRDDLRKRDPTSPELPGLNKTIQNHICVHKRKKWKDFVETMDQKTDVTKLAPNDTAYKWWSCHSRQELLCKLCRTLPPPAMGARFTVFWACRPCGPAGWLALLLTKAGDVETNPGPTTLNKRVWMCDICHKQIHVRKQIYIRCNRIEHWVHLRCAGIRQAQYTDTWTCHLHRESRLTPHTDITPPHRSRPWSKPPTHSPPTPPTPPQPKHRHTSNTPPVPTGLVKPKPNSLIHSPPSPPTPPRAKHIHMTHTPPTPLTTLISSTSPVLDITPEPRVPLIHALTTTTPPPDPTPALPSPSHPHTLTAYTHATQTTVQASQTPQQPHSQHRVLGQPHKQTKDYHRTTNTTQTHRPSSRRE